MEKNMLRTQIEILSSIFGGIVIGAVLAIITYQWIWQDLLNYQNDSFNFYILLGVIVGAELGLAAWSWIKNRSLGLVMVFILLLSIVMISFLIAGARQGS